MDIRAALKSAGASGLVVGPGDVCLVDDKHVVIPETPEEKRKYHENGRTCLVLSNEEMCNTVSFPIFSIAPISHLVHLKDSCDFRINPTGKNGLHEPSIIMLGHIQPVRKLDVFKKIGTLADEEYERVLAHILSNFDR
jgi:mRNA-degrading endonuclease toxin of MazEF toxin-antitoxin module